MANNTAEIKVSMFTDLELLQYIVHKYKMHEAPNEVKFVKDDTDIDMVCQYLCTPSGSKEVLIPIGKDHTAFLYLSDEAVATLMENFIKG